MTNLKFQMKNGKSRGPLAIVRYRQTLSLITSHPDPFEMIPLRIVVALNVDGLQLSGNGRYINQAEVTRGSDAANRNQFAKVARSNCFCGARAKHETHDPVSRAGWATPLRMTKHHR